MQRGAYSTNTPKFKDMFYLQWRIWPPNNTEMTEAHWHREVRTEAFVFGDGYWHGSGSVVDQFPDHQFRETSSRRSQQPSLRLDRAGHPEQ